MARQSLLPVNLSRRGAYKLEPPSWRNSPKETREFRCARVQLGRLGAKLTGKGIKPMATKPSSTTRAEYTKLNETQLGLTKPNSTELNRAKLSKRTYRPSAESLRLEARGRVVGRLTAQCQTEISWLFSLSPGSHANRCFAKRARIDRSPLRALPL